MGHGMHRPLDGELEAMRRGGLRLHPQTFRERPKTIPKRS